MSRFVDVLDEKQREAKMEIMRDQRQLKGGSERDECHRKFNEESEKVSERRRGKRTEDSFAQRRLRTQMRQR